MAYKGVDRAQVPDKGCAHLWASYSGEELLDLGLAGQGKWLPELGERALGLEGATEQKPWPSLEKPTASRVGAGEINTLTTPPPPAPWSLASVSP